MQTVKNKTTVLILVFKEILQTSIRPLISVLYAKGYHDFPSNFFCLTLPKYSVREPFGVSLISGFEKFYASEGYVTISVETFLSHSTEKLCTGALLCCVSEKFR